MLDRVMKARISKELSEFIRYAHAAARKQGFSTIVVGDRYAVITRDASLRDALDGCLSDMVDSALSREPCAYVPSATATCP
jgi:hypothetical protein